jgi:hypothetical protein
MKNNKISLVLFIALWFSEATELILLATLQFLPRDTIVKNVFWGLIAISIVLALSIKFLDRDGTIFTGEYLKSRNPKLFTLYQISFKWIPILMILLGVLAIRISET